MDNCKEVKNTISANDIEGDHSVSKNQAALDFYSQGLTEYKKENYKDAIVYFEKVLKIDSDFTFAWDNLGICYRKMNDFDKAIATYQKSLELDPRGIMPLQNIAVAYRYKNEFDKAIEAYQKLATLDKNDPEVYYGLGETYALYLKDYEKGLDNMCKAYTLYTKQQSPYRTDAEKIIGSIYSEMKKQNKLSRFHEILKENHIDPVE
jgi:tetratricopeptide (TPR) repeat protein